MKLYLLVFIFILLNCNNDTESIKNIPNDVLVNIKNSIHIDSLYANIETLQLKNRFFALSHIDTSRQFIMNKISPFVDNVNFDSFENQGITSKNIIAVRHGTDLNLDPIIIGAHYDSRNENSMKNWQAHQIAPGANDNGSGVSALLEIARIFKDLNLKRTIKFVFFDSEEDSLQGSRFYARKASENAEPIHFMFNLDMIGGSEISNNQIICEEDRNKLPSHNDLASVNLNQKLLNIFQNYTSLSPKKGAAQFSDYDYFQKYGYVIIGLFENNGTLNSHYHQKNDSIQYINKDYYRQAVQGSAIFLAVECGLN